MSFTRPAIALTASSGRLVALLYAALALSPICSVTSTLPVHNDPHVLEYPTPLSDATFYAHHGCLPGELSEVEVDYRGDMQTPQVFQAPCASASANFRRQSLSTFYNETSSGTVEATSRLSESTDHVTTLLKMLNPDWTFFPTLDELVDRRIVLDLDLGDVKGSGFTTQLTQVITNMVMAYVLQVPMLLPRVWSADRPETHQYETNDLSAWINVDTLVDAVQTLPGMRVLYPTPTWAASAERVELRVRGREVVLDGSANPSETIVHAMGEATTLEDVQAVVYTRASVNFPTDEYLREEQITATLDPRAPEWEHIFLQRRGLYDSDSLLSGNLRDEITRRQTPAVLSMNKHIGWVGKFRLRTPLEREVARHILKELRPSPAVWDILQDVVLYLETVSGGSWGVLHVRTEKEATQNPNSTVNVEGDANRILRIQLERQGYAPHDLQDSGLYIASGHHDYTSVREVFAGYNLVTKHDLPAELIRRLEMLNGCQRASLDYFLSIAAPVFLGTFGAVKTHFPKLVAMHRHLHDYPYELLYDRDDPEETRALSMWMELMYA